MRWMLHKQGSRCDESAGWSVRSLKLGWRMTGIMWSWNWPVRGARCSTWMVMLLMLGPTVELSYKAYMWVGLVTVGFGPGSVEAVG